MSTWSAVASATSRTPCASATRAWWIASRFPFPTVRRTTRSWPPCWRSCAAAELRRSTLLRNLRVTPCLRSPGARGAVHFRHLPQHEDVHMSLQELRDRLTLPLIGAPMFIASGPELVLAQCRAGVLGCFPSLNARTPEILDEWLTRLKRELSGGDAAPFGVNLILHKGNPRQREDLELIVRHKAPLVIT